MARISQLEPTRVTVGVDTHRDVHVAVALDQLGRRLDQIELATTRAGYERLLAWAESLGVVEAFGVEGTGCYGAALARSTEAAGSPKAGNDLVEMIRVLRVARGTAIKARTQAINALRSLLVTAPPELRDQLRALSTTRLVGKAAQLRPGALGSPLAASKLALRHLARRCQTLEAEIRSLDGQLARLTATASPQLIGAFGVGADTAGALLVAAGDNPDRLRSEAAFSMLCGSSPIKACSGKTNRHRLNRGGNRQANAALHRIVLVRLRYHQATKDYVERRTSEGKSKREIIRCLKRYAAREIYAALTQSGDQKPARAT